MSYASVSHSEMETAIETDARATAAEQARLTAWAGSPAACGGLLSVMSGGDPAATAFVEVFIAVWIILFLASFVVGVVRLVLWARRVRSIAELRRTGQRVTAQVTKISRESAFIARDYRTVWYIEADWTNLKTGIPYRLKSDPLGRRRAKPYARGELTGVLVDPADPNRYYVERAH